MVVKPYRLNMQVSIRIYIVPISDRPMSLYIVTILLFDGRENDLSLWGINVDLHVASAHHSRNRNSPTAGTLEPCHSIRSLPCYLIEVAVRTVERHGCLFSLLLQCYHPPFSLTADLLLARTFGAVGNSDTQVRWSVFCVSYHFGERGIAPNVSFSQTLLLIVRECT